MAKEAERPLWLARVGLVKASSSVRRALIMKFTNQHRPYLVGAQFIGAPPIYRPGAGIDGPLADNEFYQPKRVITPIGTRAYPAFCRDKGRMRRWEGAWCLSSCMAIPPGFPADPLEHLTRTRTS